MWVLCQSFSRLILKLMIDWEFFTFILIFHFSTQSELASSDLVRQSKSYWLGKSNTYGDLSRWIDYAILGRKPNLEELQLGLFFFSAKWKFVFLLEMFPTRIKSRLVLSVSNLSIQNNILWERTFVSLIFPNDLIHQDANNIFTDKLLWAKYDIICRAVAQTIDKKMWK